MVSFWVVPSSLFSLPGAPVGRVWANPIIGIAIKAAIFPMHLWLPDAYTYSPSIVSTVDGEGSFSSGFCADLE